MQAYRIVQAPAEFIDWTARLVGAPPHGRSRPPVFSRRTVQSAFVWVSASTASLPADRERDPAGEGGAMPVYSDVKSNDRET